MASATGLGAAVGALVTAGRGRTRLRALTIGPPRQRRVCRSNCSCSPWSGPASVSFLAVGNTTVQLTTLPTMRGRVMALQAVAFLGSTPTATGTVRPRRLDHRVSCPPTASRPTVEASSSHRGGRAPHGRHRPPRRWAGPSASLSPPPRPVSSVRRVAPRQLEYASLLPTALAQVSCPGRHPTGQPLSLI